MEQWVEILVSVILMFMPAAVGIFFLMLKTGYVLRGDARTFQTTGWKILIASLIMLSAVPVVLWQLNFIAEVFRESDEWNNRIGAMIEHGIPLGLGVTFACIFAIMQFETDESMRRSRRRRSRFRRRQNELAKRYGKPLGPPRSLAARLGLPAIFRSGTPDMYLPPWVSWAVLGVVLLIPILVVIYLNRPV